MPAYKQHLKWICFILSVTFGLSLLAGCSLNAETTTETTATTARPGTIVGTGGTTANDRAISVIEVDYQDDDLDGGFLESSSTKISLGGTSALASGSGATVSGTEVVIESAGTYLIKGSLTNGRILVSASDKDVVRLVLAGADIVSKNGAPIEVKSAKKVILIVADGTENRMTDESAYDQSDQDASIPNAAIYSKADLTINGQGSLSVEAKHAHGIVSKDDLKIIGGTLHVTASGDGLKGKDLVAIKGGSITIAVEGDGIQSSNGEEKEKGNIILEGGQVSVTSGLDGLQAERNVQVTVAHLTIMAGGGHTKGTQKDPLPGMGFRPGVPGPATSVIDTNEVSRKGIKAKENMLVLDGSINIDAADDALHSNATIMIKGGYLTLASGDDGVHADTSIEINNGDVTISNSYEGIESARVTFNGGNVRVTARDDGINVAGGVDGSSIGGRPGQNAFTTDTDVWLAINGGTIYVNAYGDGVDANGPITMSDGTLIIDGPTENNNGALDFSTFQITGGLLIAAGSSGMAVAPDSPSTQNTIMVNFNTSLPAGTLVNITSSDGEPIVTFAPQKTYQSFIISSPSLKTGESYVISTGGSSTGTSVDGFYPDGQYQNGTIVATVAIRSVLTRYGTAGWGGAGGRPGGPGGRR